MLKDRPVFKFGSKKLEEKLKLDPVGIISDLDLEISDVKAELDSFSRKKISKL